MRPSHALLLTLSLSLLATSLHADDAKKPLTGRWKTAIELGGESREYYFDIVQDGEKVTGALISPRSGRYAFQSATLKDGELRIEVDREFDGNSVTLEFAGKVAADGTIPLSLSAGGNGLAELALSRLPSPVGTWDVKSYSPDGQREFVSTLVVERSEKGLTGKSASERGSLVMKTVEWKNDRLFLALELEIQGVPFPIELDLGFKDANKLEGKWKGKGADGSEYVGDWGAVRKVSTPTPKEYELHADKLFDRSHVVEVAIELPEKDWNELRSQARHIATALGKEIPANPFTYFKGNITIDGVRIEGVGVRKKGFIGSLDETRPSLKIKFSEYEDLDPVRGIDRLTLNNNKQDDSLTSQYLTYKIFADAGVHAPRCNFAHVKVNGKSLGIYANVESVKKPFLRQRFGEDSGRLYEGTLADFIDDCTTRLEAKNKAAEMNRDFIAEMTKTLALEDDSKFAKIEEKIDLDAFLKFWAVESLVSFWDGYATNQNNYFIYENPKNKKLYWIPWGADASFRVAPPILMIPRGAESVATNARLPFTLFANEAMRERYRKTLVKILEDTWKDEEILAEIDGLPKLVEGRLHPYQSHDFEDALARNRRFIERRRERIEEELADWPPDIPGKSHIPVFTETVGTVKGTFDTKWFAKAPTDGTKEGKATLEFVLDDKTVDFGDMGTFAGLGQAPPGSRIGPGELPPPAITVVAKRAKGKKIVIVAIGISRLKFGPSSEPIPVQGMVLEQGGFFGGSFRFASGTATFEKASEEADAPIVGRFDLNVFKMSRR